jgi:glycyl-tRNA synthetase (class II)
VRFRDSMEQVRVRIEELPERIRKATREYRRVGS